MSNNFSETAPKNIDLTLLYDTMQNWGGVTWLNPDINSFDSAQVAKKRKMPTRSLVALCALSRVCAKVWIKNQGAEYTTVDFAKLYADVGVRNGIGSPRCG